MSKRKKRRSNSGTDKQMLAAEETPVATQEAERTVANDAVMPMTISATNAADDCVAAVPSPVQEPDNADLFEGVAAIGTTAAADPPPSIEPPAIEAPHKSLGQRLRAAREAKGWGAEDVGSRLRLPLQIIRDLEAERYEKIGYGIYLRGYLMSYARLVGVPTVLIDPVLRDRSEAPPLVASGTISHSRYLYQRYSVSALYLILTGVIIVPAVLLAMRAGMQPNVGAVSALDSSVVSAPASPGEARGTGSETDASGQSATGAAAPPQHAAAETALVASLAPFQALSHKDEPAQRSEPVVPAGAHTLRLTLKESSWVEVTSANGEKLEYGLLQGGSVRTYSSDQALEVRLGNCNGAEVETDGKAQDLAAYRHANVAHFKLFAGDQAISRID